MTSTLNEKKKETREEPEYPPGTSVEMAPYDPLGHLSNVNDAKAFASENTSLIRNRAVVVKENTKKREHLSVANHSDEVTERSRRRNKDNHERKRKTNGKKPRRHIPGETVPRWGCVNVD